MSLLLPKPAIHAPVVLGPDGKPVEPEPKPKPGTLTLTCYRCLKYRHFSAESREKAFHEALAGGWSMQSGGKPCCKKCTRRYARA